jgi:ABC-type nitrate/sulfonate/bicarbonate transport system ATPase subunit
LQDHLVQTWLAELRTVVYVTHDIDEAVFLADRIAIMTPSPGRVGAEIGVEIGRPRDRGSSAVAELKHRITALMHEMDRPK